MNTDQLTAMLDNAYVMLAQARMDLFNAAEAHITAKDTLARAQRTARAEGKITGKNELERDDCARLLLPDLYAAVDTAATTERRYAFIKDLADEELARARALLRLHELTAGTQLACMPGAASGPFDLAAIFEDRE